MQLLPGTARRAAELAGIPWSDDRLWEPALSARLGAFYLARLLDRFHGSEALAAAAYNAGAPPVARWLARAGDRPLDEFVERIPFDETRLYVKRVAEIHARYLHRHEGRLWTPPLRLPPAPAAGGVDF
jgi:soluble lytic murein transglycosylase